ncbi:Aldo-keto reductase family 1 member B10 (aldose reductase) [Fasciola gigantica]|uniref:Aldo-keto reductase family 1 member B10 (Aldose reductase) n=1 Tax=Fasciola gigantica TaxID=46835 RepID=A0A504YKW0_FASGI|nr:Aldo-keto reductase family 1 member B10 (aldose reductase) [Fasciola gigantica]
MPMETLQSPVGNQIPSLGLGTWRCKPKHVSAAVSCAIKNGYRHIDCAYLYSNEKEIGNALEDSLSSCALGRENLFVTSKVYYGRRSFSRSSLKSVAPKALGISNLRTSICTWPILQWLYNQVMIYSPYLVQEVHLLLTLFLLSRRGR